MRIAIADNNNLKFTQDLKDHWEKGHEVRYERGSSEFLAQWADIYYCDTWDNNLGYLFRLYHGQHTDYPSNWDNNKKPRIICRILDWEVWLGHCRDQEMINWVDEFICIAPHIEEKLRKEADFGDKLHLIRPGVNLNKFTLKTKQTDGFQLGMMLGDMWWPKNHMAGLDIFTTLYQQNNRWRFHIRGQHEPGEYWKQMYEYYLDSRGIREVVTLYNYVDNVNEWLENVDILLHPGMKEAFCYAVAEAMAKGITTVVNNFLGSENIWGKMVLSYDTHEEAVKEILDIHDANDRNNWLGKPWGKLREELKSVYSLERMLTEYDQLLGL